MFVQRISRRFNAAIRHGVAHGLLPFDWGASRLRVDLREFSQGRRRPTTFTEKVRYKLARDRRPIARLYADKLAVRDYVHSVSRSVRLPRLLGVYDSAAEAAACAPSCPWVMKGSHGSGMILISPATNSVPRSVVSRHAEEWLQTDYALRYWEWQYFRLPRRILFEEYLGEGSATPDDYKLYVIHQKVRFIEVDQGRYTRHTRDFFTPDWTPIRSRIGPAPVASNPPSRPERLAEMIAIAEELSRETDFLRVDLYFVRGEIYFGELTHSPAAGNFGFQDRRLDEDLGRGWKLPLEYR